MDTDHRVLGLALLLAAGAAACGDGANGTGGAGGAGTTTSTTSAGGTDAGGGGGGDGGAAGECGALPSGPIDPVVTIDVLEGSEDLAFDGKGRIAAKRGPNVVLVDATEQIANFASLSGTVYGLRYRPDGYLIAARSSGTVSEISPAGTVGVLAEGLEFPNGVYPDEDGNVWVTEFSGNRVSRIDSSGRIDEIAGGAPEVSQPNGIVLDSARGKLFYTNYSAGEIRSLDPGVPDSAPLLVATIQGASLDGIVLDACGNLYAVDNGRGRLYRARLDAAGAAVGEPEQLAEFPQSVANPQFGSGPAFDAKTIYVVGTPGTVYAVAVGVAGAKIPAPP